MDRQYFALLWGSLLGVSTIIVGIWVYFNRTVVPPSGAYPFFLLGGFAIVMGAYITYTVPEPKEYDSIAVFKPTNLPAYTYAVIAALFLLLTLHLLYRTQIDLIWPTLTFLGFLGSFLGALFKYWKNMLTTYYVTSFRLISEYRFISLTRTSFEHEDITNVTRQQSILETLLGLGTIEVTVPNGTITLENLQNPDEAEELLNDKRV